jgi:hypothetical protein
MISSHLLPQHHATTIPSHVTSQEEIQRLHLPKRMAWLSSQRQGKPVVIDTPRFLPENKRPATWYSGVTVDGPHADAQGNAWNSSKPGPAPSMPPMP